MKVEVHNFKVPSTYTNVVNVFFFFPFALHKWNYIECNLISNTFLYISLRVNDTTGAIRNMYYINDQGASTAVEFRVIKYLCHEGSHLALQHP